MPTTVALFGALPLSRTVAWIGGRALSAAQLLADAQALAPRLPAGQAVNLDGIVLGVNAPPVTSPPDASTID